MARRAPPPPPKKRKKRRKKKASGSPDPLALVRAFADEIAGAEPEAEGPPPPPKKRKKRRRKSTKSVRARLKAPTSAHVEPTAGMAERFRWAREHFGLTRQALDVWLRRFVDQSGRPAFDVDSPIPIAAVEEGRTPPTLRLARAWARCTKVHLPWLLRGELAELTAEEEERLDAIPSPVARKRARLLWERLDGGFIPEGEGQRLSKPYRSMQRADADIPDIHEERSGKE